MNAGNDELLELVKEKNSDDQLYYPSRILLKFKNEEVKDLINNTIGSSIFNTNSKVSLNLYQVQNENLIGVLNLEAFAVSQSWDEGTGRFSNIPTGSNGCSWLFRDNSITKTVWPTGSFGDGSSGSINAVGITEGGGTWYTGSLFQGSQQFLQGDDLDTDIDITTIVQKHSASLFNNSTYPVGIENQGIIIKQPDSVEQDTSSSFGEIQYFSVDTHTIYPPKLVFKWDDSSYTLPDGKEVISGSINVSLYNNREEYNQNDEAFFRIHVRDKYPTRQFTSSSNYLNPGYFTTSSFYSVRDSHTEEEVIPFDDNFTKISADTEGMYFKVYMKGLQPERYYRVLFKHTNNEGTIIYDDNYHFKVVR